jgi:hypothetical protein
LLFFERSGKVQTSVKEGSPTTMTRLHTPHHTTHYERAIAYISHYRLTQLATASHVKSK